MTWRERPVIYEIATQKPGMATVPAAANNAAAAATTNKPALR